MTNFWLYMCDMGRNGGTVDERKISMTGYFGSVLGTCALSVYPVISRYIHCVGNWIYIWRKISMPGRIANLQRDTEYQCYMALRSLVSTSY